MMGVLNNLEPIRFEKREIIYDELDDCGAIYFLMKKFAQENHPCF